MNKEKKAKMKTKFTGRLCYTCGGDILYNHNMGKTANMSKKYCSRDCYHGSLELQNTLKMEDVIEDKGLLFITGNLITPEKQMKVLEKHKTGSYI